jgi:GDP-mannose transporter
MNKLSSKHVADDQVGSSIIAAWSDISRALSATPILDPTTGAEIAAVVKPMIGGINVGYFWMALNCFASAAYVSANLASCVVT